MTGSPMGMSFLDWGMQRVGKRVDWSHQRRDTRNDQLFTKEMYDKQRQHFLEDRKYDESFLSRLVKGAQDAGLHPLAALGANMSGAVFRGSDFGKGTPGTPPSDRTTFAESALLAAQIRNLDAQTDFTQEQAAASRLSRTTQSMTPDKVIPYMEGHEVKDPQITDKPRVLGMDMERSGLFSDMQSINDAYGEPVEWVAGVLSIMSDLGMKINKKTVSIIKKLIDEGKLTDSNQRYKKHYAR